MAVSDLEQALRDDVRLLGELLGETLSSQEGAWLLQLVEDIRQLAKAIRAGKQDSTNIMNSGLPALRAVTSVRRYAPDYWI